MIKHNPKRTIQNAVDIETGELINAKTLNDELYANHFRTRINSNDEKIICLECEKELAVSINRKNKDLPTYYFYHRNNFSECDLVNGNLSKNEVDKLNKIFSSKETQRHKDLKQFIYDRLLKIEQIDKESIKIEKWFFQNGKLQRKPDVYCIYNGQKIAFEVQISDLSQRYMLERYNYYKNEQIYVIWILENFDFENNRQFIKDIQELNNYQNIFKLNENSKDLSFFCSYPEVYLTKNLEINDKIIEKEILFNQLEFDNFFQVFYYDYPVELRKKAKEKDEIIKKRELDRQKDEIERKLELEREIKNTETKWQNKWLALTKNHNAVRTNNIYVTEHCYFYIQPNNQFVVFFPEKNITQNEIYEIEERNSNLFWIVNTEKFFKKGEIRSIVTGYLNTLNSNFNQEDCENHRNELTDKIQSLEKKKTEKENQIDRLNNRILEKQNEKSKTIEIREKLLTAILKNEFFYEKYELKKTVSDKFKEQLLNLNNNNFQNKKEKNDILATLNTVSAYKDEKLNGKILKRLPQTPDKKDISDHFDNFTIILKSTLYTLMPEIVKKDKLPYVFYKPDDYVYLYDYSILIENLNLKLAKLEELQTKNELEKLNYNSLIDLEIEVFLNQEIETLSKNILDEKFELETILKELKVKSEELQSIIDEYNSDKDLIMKTYKRLYSFEWKPEIVKWKNTKNNIFFDTDENYLFWVNGEYQLKKVYYNDFIDKLKTIKTNKKKWL